MNTRVLRNTAAAIALLIGVGACAPAPSGATRNSQTGGVSYYTERGTIAFPKYRSSHGCAHRTAKAGTVLVLTYKGRRTTCVVDDRGPFVSGRVVDLQPTQFKALGPISAGVLNGVTVRW